ncbi:exodeoxyribonuclease VII large subunit [Aquabacterium sp.]|uniref:exodeoxyribonuclease VII large subunit n=1 Tax=Aquabacterium sp. TaxID=1872578 RepID=UPI0035AD9D42
MSDAFGVRGGGARPRVWGVSALVQAVADSLAARFAVCVIRGEISGFSRAASGHCYFTLKDESGGASLRCAMFRRAASQLAELPREGWRVEVLGQLGVYEPRGELQFVVEALQRAGAGSLYEQFLQLKARLEAEGLFAAERKRSIARFPRAVGVVTSPAAAALHDVLTALQRRAPHVRVVLYPCSVQGAEAPAQIVEAIGRAAARREVDTLLVCRGGGTLEDLWSFNDERVVRAIAECPLPVISGVGHETDVTLADFAADLRAPTPTAAAELCALSSVDAFEALMRLEQRALQRCQVRVDRESQRLDHLLDRLSRPAQALHRRRLALADLALRCEAARRAGLMQQQHALQRREQDLARGTRTTFSEAKHRLDRLAVRLQGLDPAWVLDRGYAWLSDANGLPITSARQAQVGQPVVGQLADGRLDLQVLHVQRVRRGKPA